MRSKKYYYYSEVVDSVKSLEKFLSMNAIAKEGIDKIIIVWKEEI